MNTITDVLSGNKPIQVDIGLNIKEFALAMVALLTVIVLAGLIIKKA